MCNIYVVPDLYQAFIFDIECNLEKTVISWTFVMKIIVPIHYICRARGKYFKFIVILDYRLRYI